MMNVRMGRRGMLRVLGLAALAPLLAAAANATPGAPPPDDSLYQLAADLTDHEGHAFELATLRGHPVLASMFYASCEMACPMIFETMKKTLKALPPAQAKDVRVLMVSFDPARDTVEALERTAKAHGLDGRWRLVRGDEATVRQVSAALGYQYRRLASGEFNHSSTITLLDREGRRVVQSASLAGSDPVLVRAVRRVLAAHA